MAKQRKQLILVDTASTNTKLNGISVIGKLLENDAVNLVSCLYITSINADLVKGHGGGYSLIWAIWGTCRWTGYVFLASLC